MHLLSKVSVNVQNSKKLGQDDREQKSEGIDFFIIVTVIRRLLDAFNLLKSQKAKIIIYYKH